MDTTSNPSLIIYFWSYGHAPYSRYPRQRGRLKNVYVSGLTIPELTDLLNKAYGEFVKLPNVTLQIIKYKPVDFLVEGEVSKPGKYLLEMPQTQTNDPNLNLTRKSQLPTLIDAIKESGGLTENADLKNIVVIRNNNLSNGGGKIKTDLDFISFITEGDFDKNIRIYDGDVINIKKYL